MQGSDQWSLLSHLPLHPATGGEGWGEGAFSAVRVDLYFFSLRSNSAKVSFATRKASTPAGMPQ
jgi:hypothetical protein